MALYRKYRPATFAEVVGQEHVTAPLSTALDTGRISHAYLFSGPRGCGKTSSARILARSLNCVEGPTSTPCGSCPSCVALGPGGSGNLDVIELDAASHGGVDDTRELRDRAFYAPAESRYRVFIVDEAHMVTTAGFNALLKIVEEPPAHLIFIFATTEPDKVLPTIRSRTHHYPFRLLPPATMRGLLGRICEQERVPVEEAVYPLVIRAGGGSPRDSLSVLDQLLAGAGPEGVTYARAVSLLGVTDVALIDDAVEALAAYDGAALFGTVDRVMEAGHDPRRFAADLLDRFRDLILLRAVPDAAERGLVTGPGDVLERMRGQAERLGPATTTRYAELLHQGLGDMRGATSPRLLLEVVCARMLLPSASDTEPATLQRLERLERGLASGSPAAASPAVTVEPARSAPASGSPADPPRRRGAEALAAIRREGRGDVPEGGVGVPAREAGAQPPGSGSGDDAGADRRSSAERGEPGRQDLPSGAAVPPPAGPTAVSPSAGSSGSAPGGEQSGSAQAEVAAAATQGVSSGAGRADSASSVSAPESGSAASGSSPAASEVAASSPAARHADARPAPTAGGAERVPGPGPSGAGATEGSGPQAVSGPAAPQAAAVTSPEADDLAARAHAAPVDAGDLLREVEAAWPEIRAKVREFGAAVQAMLAGASVSRIDGDVVVFAHQHAPLAQRLSDARNLEAVRAAVRAVLGRDLDVRWEAGGATPRPAAASRSGSADRGRGTARGQAPARESGNAPGRGTDAAAPPRFSRPSRTRDAGGDKGPGGGRSRPGGSTARPHRGEDDIPPPDYPDLPDDPGPADYPPPYDAPGNESAAARGWGGEAVIPPPTPEEEQEMLAAAADPVAPGDRRDPDEVALELLRAELGATRLDG